MFYTFSKLHKGRFRIFKIYRRIFIFQEKKYNLKVLKKRSGWGKFDGSVGTLFLFFSRCGTIKIPPCSKALSAEHRSKF
jgi:hypothetical protein